MFDDFLLPMLACIDMLFGFGTMPDGPGTANDRLTSNGKEGVGFFTFAPSGGHAIAGRPNGRSSSEVTIFNGFFGSGGFSRRRTHRSQGQSSVSLLCFIIYKN